MRKRTALLAFGLCLTLILTSAARAAEVTFTVGGDVLLGGNVDKKTDARFDAYYKAYGPQYMLKYFIPLFSGDDITILNLEGPLKISARPNTRNGRHTPMHGQPEYVNILTSSSVEAVNVANNHMNDYNTKKATLKILAENGITYGDSGFSKEANSIVVNGLRVGFLGYMTPYSFKGVRKDLKRARAQCDIVVVSYHFGEVPSTSSVIRASQVRAAHIAVNNGADLVLGHHPHVVSGIEIYKGKYIFYDLGSLVSSGKKLRFPTMVARITLSVDSETGKVTSGVPTVYPGYTSSAGSNQDNNCQPILYREGDAGYDTVFSIIDKFSVRRGITPGEYLRG